VGISPSGIYGEQEQALGRMGIAAMQIQRDIEVIDRNPHGDDDDH
jgi:hypothetical protein